MFIKRCFVGLILIYSVHREILPVILCVGTLKQMTTLDKDNL